MFNKLVFEQTPANINIANLISHTKQKEMLEECLNSSDDNLKVSLIYLFMYLYAQNPEKVVNIELKDIEKCSEGSYKVKFGVTPISLPMQIGNLLDRYLGLREP
jgi:hypothetical protein